MNIQPRSIRSCCECRRHSVVHECECPRTRTGRRFQGIDCFEAGQVEAPDEEAPGRMRLLEIELNDKDSVERTTRRPQYSIYHQPTRVDASRASLPEALSRHQIVREHIQTKTGLILPDMLPDVIQSGIDIMRRALDDYLCIVLEVECPSNDIKFPLDHV